MLSSYLALDTVDSFKKTNLCAKAFIISIPCRKGHVTNTGVQGLGLHYF